MIGAADRAVRRARSRWSSSTASCPTRTKPCSPSSPTAASARASCTRLRAGRDGGDPAAGGEHRLQRLPAACCSCWHATSRRRGSSCGWATASPSATASSCCSLAAAVIYVAFGGTDRSPDTAVRGRRVPGLHAVPGRAWSCTGGACATRTGARAWPSTRPAACSRRSCSSPPASPSSPRGAWVVPCSRSAWSSCSPSASAATTRGRRGDRAASPRDRGARAPRSRRARARRPATRRTDRDGGAGDHATRGRRAATTRPRRVPRRSTT